MFDFLNPAERPESFWSQDSVPKQIKSRDPAAALSVVAVLAPWPGASNFPATWLIWTAVIALIWGSAPQRVTGHAVTAVQIHLLWLISFLASFALVQAAQGILATSYGFLPQPSQAPSQSLLAALRICGLALVLVIWFGQRRSGRDMDRYLDWIFWGVVAQAMWALPNMAGASAGDDVVERSKSGILFLSRNAFAMQLGFGLVLGLARFARKLPEGRFLASVGLTAIAVALFATQSRLGIVSCFCGVLCVTALFAPSFKVTVYRVSAIVLLFLVGLWLGGGWDRMAGLPQSFSVRIALYRQVLALIGENLFSGVGLDAFPVAFVQVHEPPVASSFIWDHAHSTYLTLWVEAGLFAGSLPLVMGLVAMFGLWSRISQSSDESARARAAVALAVLLQVAVHSLFDFAVEIYANLLTLVTLVAAALSPGLTNHHFGDENGR